MISDRMTEKKDTSILKRRFRISILVLCLLLTSAICTYGYIEYVSTISEITSEASSRISRIAAESVDGDSISSYLKTGKKDTSDYKKLESVLGSAVHESELYFINVAAPLDEKHFMYIYSSYEGLTGRTEEKEDIDEFFEHMGAGDPGISVPVRIQRIKDSAGGTAAFVVFGPREDKIKEMSAYYLAFTIGIIAVLTVLFFIVFSTKLERLIVRPIRIITGETSEFVSNVKKDEVCTERLEVIKTEDELQDLAENVMKMERDIIEYIEKTRYVVSEKERIAAEMNVAAEIQSSMLPAIFPPFPERDDIDIYAKMTPARSVGGDFYDFFFIDEERLGVTVADVSGKGVPASLFMAVAKTLIKNCAQCGSISTKRIMEEVNELICRDNLSDMFVTAWFAIINVKTGEGTAVNAGHENPAIKRRDGHFEMSRLKHSVPLGVMDGVEYREYEFSLEPGDRIFVYTDGVTEASDINGNFFGEERLADALRKAEDKGIREVLSCVETELDIFSEGAEQFDDITMMCIDFFGT